VEGTCDERFRSLQSLLEDSVDEGHEIGAGLCVWYEGREVVDLSVGTRNAAGDPWTSDTLVHTYSTAKPFAALGLLRLVAQGVVGLDTLVAERWPAFAVNGKQHTTVRHLLSHQSGVWAFPSSVVDLDPLDDEGLIACLADAVPSHAPGDGIGEHVLTYGHLLDGVARSTTGDKLADLFEEVAQEAGWDIHLRLTDADLPRVADLVHLSPGWPQTYFGDLEQPLARALGRPQGLLAVDVLNSRRWRTGSFPAIGLHATAHALGSFYAHVLDPDGPVARLLGPALHEAFTTVQVEGHDRVLDREVAWTLGMQRDEQELGMGSVGGSSAWLSLDKGYACAYVTRGLGTNARVDAVWDELERLL